MKYKFTLEKRKKDGVLIEKNVPIRITINNQGKRITLSTGYRIDKIAWDETAQIVKQGYFNNQKEPYNIINSNLADQKSYIDRFALKCQVDKIDVDLENLKVEFAEHFSRKRNTRHSEQIIEKSFFDLWTEFQNENGKQNSWSDSTFEKFRSLGNHLKKFDKNIHINSFTTEKLTSLIDYFLYKAKMKNRTVNKQFGYLKWFLNWAVEKGYTNITNHKSFKTRLKIAKNPVIYLTSEELDKIRCYKIPESKKYLDRVRDVFLFCCYTSLRYSDVAQLKKHDIINNRISLISVKTTGNIGTKLNDKAIRIIEKYKSIPFENYTALPIISNQKMNDYIKDLCEFAEIDSKIRLVEYYGNKRIETTHSKFNLIGTHTGRRTFICNALKNGMPVHAVMKITGHSDYKSMKPYIDIVNQEVDNMIDKYINF